MGPKPSVHRALPSLAALGTVDSQITGTNTTGPPKPGLLKAQSPVLP